MEQKYEIWDGVEVMTPSSFFHEVIVGNVIFLLNTHVKKNKLGFVTGSNVKVYLDESEPFKCPDVIFLSHSNMNIVKKESIHGAPDLIVEVVSAGIRNTERDTIDKKELYRKYGVQEYWLVDPYEEEVVIFSLQEGQYIQINESRVLEGIQVNKSIFE